MKRNKVTLVMLNGKKIEVPEERIKNDPSGAIGNMFVRGYFKDGSEVEKGKRTYFPICAVERIEHEWWDEGEKSKEVVKEKEEVKKEKDDPGDLF